MNENTIVSSVLQKHEHKTLMNIITPYLNKGTLDYMEGILLLTVIFDELYDNPFVKFNQLEGVIGNKIPELTFTNYDIHSIDEEKIAKVITHLCKVL